MSETAAGNLAIFGAGAMGSALLKGFLDSGILSAKCTGVYDIDPGRQEALCKATGARSFASSVEAAQWADMVLVAVKPPAVLSLLHEIRDDVDGGMVISIAAGVSVGAMEHQLAPKAQVVRVMPNTPAVVGTCASAISFGEWVKPEQKAFICRLFDSVGISVVVDEKLMDAVTGLSGSGPAYVFTVIEALADGGVGVGLPRETAAKLAAETVMGAAKMVLETGEHPAKLRDQVTSPGGTTIAGLAELEKGGLRAALMSAVSAAARRSAELGK